jgi:hypothetical protein
VKAAGQRLEANNPWHQSSHRPNGASCATFGQHIADYYQPTQLAFRWIQLTKKGYFINFPAVTHSQTGITMSVFSLLY